MSWNGFSISLYFNIWHLTKRGWIFGKYNYESYVLYLTTTSYFCEIQQTPYLDTMFVSLKLWTMIFFHEICNKGYENWCFERLTFLTYNVHVFLTSSLRHVFPKPLKKVANIAFLKISQNFEVYDPRFLQSKKIFTSCVSYGCLNDVLWISMWRMEKTANTSLFTTRIFWKQRFLLNLFFCLNNVSCSLWMSNRRV